mmetsp:Transcript_5991/g.9885  ORF Transcript_5991/g.9885 Transcript_5991/m.9885 type:complete len:565 (+) Transcript_5991:926-2620(+)
MNNSGEEIVTLLDSVFTDRNVVSHLDEVGITLDASLPQVINMEGKLGIAKTALKPIFVYAIPKLFSLLHSDSSTHNMGVECHKQLISVSRAVLLVKGDFPAAFNCRKLAIENGKLEVIDEIQFTALLFTLHPKCPSGWHHRRWCLARKFNVRVNMFTASIQEISTISKTLSAGVIETERVLCSNMAEKHPKNYYAWLHRLWLLQFMKHHQLCDELQFTREWLFAHVSDHSAVNHRIQVIRRIMLCDEAQNILLRECNSTVTADVKFCRWVLENCEEDDSDRCSHNLKGENRENRKQGEHVCTVITGILKKFLVLDHLLNDCEALIRDRPGHQSLWCLRRMLLEMLFETVKAEFGSSILPSVGDISFDRSSLEKLFSFTNDNIAAPNAATTTTTTIAAGTTTTTAAAALATNIAGVAWSIAEPAWISMDVRFSLLHGALLVPATAATPVTATSNGKLLQQVSRGDSADTMVPLSPQVLSEWLVALLIQELRIVHFCSTDTSNWDPIVQSRMALRYGAFLIERVGILIHTCIDPKRNDPFLIHEPMKANSSWDCIISKLSRQFQDI